VKGKPMQNERRNINRRKFGYYMPVIDNRTQQCIGYLSDISSQGFKLDSQKPLTVNTDFSLRLDLTPEISKRAYIVFFARVIWSQLDPINPNDYINGFQILSITPGEQEIFQRIVETYGKSENNNLV
jgi:hypothetical protein